MKKVEVKLSSRTGYDQYVILLTNENSDELLDNKEIVRNCENGDDETLQDIFYNFWDYDPPVQFRTIENGFEQPLLTVDGKDDGVVQYLKVFEGGEDQPIKPVEIKNLPMDIKSNIQLIADRLNKERFDSEIGTYWLDDLDSYCCMLEAVSEVSLNSDDVYMIRTDKVRIEATYIIELPDEEEFDSNKLFFFVDMSEHVFMDGEWHQIYLGGVVYDGVWYKCQDEDYIENYTVGSWITQDINDYDVLWHNWEEF